MKETLICIHSCFVHALKIFRNIIGNQYLLKRTSEYHIDFWKFVKTKTLNASMQMTFTLESRSGSLICIKYLYRLVKNIQSGLCCFRLTEKVRGGYTIWWKSIFPISAYKVLSSTALKGQHIGVFLFMREI